jgi:hypothetical protein
MRAVVGGGIVLLDGRARKEDEEMNYQMHFDPYQTEHLNQRHEELMQHMEVLRLEERLRENHGGYAARFTDLIRRLRCYMGQSLQGSPSPPCTDR